MDSQTMYNEIEVVVPEKKIAERIQSLSNEINREYGKCKDTAEYFCFWTWYGHGRHVSPVTVYWLQEIEWSNP